MNFQTITITLLGISLGAIIALIIKSKAQVNVTAVFMENPKPLIDKSPNNTAANIATAAPAPSPLNSQQIANLLVNPQITPRSFK